MGATRHKPEAIVSKLRQVEVQVGQGMPRIDAIREVSITDADALPLGEEVWRHGHRSTQRGQASSEGE
jgi:hypothetical protein